MKFIANILWWSLTLVTQGEREKLNWSSETGSWHRPHDRCHRGLAPMWPGETGSWQCPADKCHHSVTPPVGVHYCPRPRELGPGDADQEGRFPLSKHGCHTFYLITLRASWLPGLTLPYLSVAWDLSVILTGPGTASPHRPPNPHPDVGPG